MSSAIAALNHTRYPMRWFLKWRVEFPRFGVFPYLVDCYTTGCTCFYSFHTANYRT